MPSDVANFLKNADSTKLVAATAAAELVGRTNDYITHLCRTGRVRGFLLGRVWYVDDESLRVFLKKTADEQQERRRALSESLRREYLQARPEHL